MKKHILQSGKFTLRIILIILFGILFSNKTITGQNNQFVYMDNDNFYLGCFDFYPKTVNYEMTFVKDIQDNYHVAPSFQLCYSGWCDSLWIYHCGPDVNAWHEQLKTHFQKIDSLDFNSVRIMGLPIVVDYDGEIRTIEYYEQIDATCYNRVEGLELDNNTEVIMGNLIQELIDIIKDNNISLKLIMVLGQHGIEFQPEPFKEYLEYIANRFKSEPVIFAYDLYNEPRYGKKPNPDSLPKITNRVIIANMVNEWYRAIKQNAPFQYVTLGSVLVDVEVWYPSLLTLDFLSYHIYSLRREVTNWELASALDKYNVILKYINETNEKPWILGETGLPGIDSTEVHPIVGSEAEQDTFAVETFKYSNWYGSKGYSWWRYKDVHWYDEISIEACQNYFGIVYYLNNLQEHKAIGDEFPLLDPYVDCPDCQHPSDSIYYNPYMYNFYEKSGYVFNMDSVPVENALISGHKRVTDYTGNDTIVYYYPGLTFTDENGYYKFYSVEETMDDYYYHWRISYPGTKTKIFWSPQDSILVSYLEEVPADSLPPPIEYMDTILITDCQSVYWDSLCLLNEHYVNIDSGAMLIIKDTVYVKPETKFVVERGGKLELDNGAIIGLCMWQGIEVWGTASAPPYAPGAHGKVVLRNEALIENALVGIKTIKVNDDQGEGQPDYNYTGGHITAYGNSTIRNCQYAVRFYPYEYDHYSGFTNITFETNAEL
ncbi:MAG: cellulase family glycosylhydrolase, partial [Bacteroidales bacterium]|nr:cellulase family glycosylhydrolase [Bacteroidales bacterium]